ncbi:hypothetical protein K443DRAFT_16072 [Laccaria amethystina LaAM-08-1]|uniref:Unplaced genomic scaffold K443scaffold_1152, whole genome shotgun sequence n=1 Tax=Laccaria amethystina LaAM-08-1 TaxID=1095629 RepID=A0A0C9WYI1_9AGAR|nr:hypothetical protein K443DRAFT_16072 [Laccaria amethystina LaAM-08-1]
MPLSPSKEYNDGAFDGNDENDILSSHSYNDYGDAMYEDDYDVEGMCKGMQANEFNQRESSPLSEESNNGSTNSRDDENDLLDKDYVPTPLDKDDEDCPAEINSDSDDYEDQEDNDYLYHDHLGDFFGHLNLSEISKAFRDFQFGKPKFDTPSRAIAYGTSTMALDEKLTMILKHPHSIEAVISIPQMWRNIN